MKKRLRSHTALIKEGWGLKPLQAWEEGEGLGVGLPCPSALIRA